VLLGGAIPNTNILLLALLYSIGAHGIMTLNDFKAIEGDRQMGIKSLPAALGVQRAAWVACIVMLVPQFVVMALLAAWDAPIHAAAIGALVLVQALMMRGFLAAPRERALFLSGAGVPFYVAGMMLAAFALRGVAQ
jgi:chlorophyll synthase